MAAAAGAAQPSLMEGIMQAYLGLKAMKSSSMAGLAAAILSVALAIPVGLAAREPQNNRLPHYTVKDLGTLGGTFSYAVALNGRGWAGGAATLSGDTAQHAVLWAKGRKIDLGTFGGPNSALFGPGINENGQVVAEAETDMQDPLGQDFCGF